jgi:hypothetical protein
MNIPNNVLKYYLRNVYFLGGTGCGGKTTMAKTIAEKYGFTLFNKHQATTDYKKVANKMSQPAMTKKFVNWGEYFDRSPTEYSDWLFALSREEIEMMLMDLVALARDKKVIVDCHVEPEVAMQFTEYSRIAFLWTDPEKIASDYFERVDHQKTHERIMALPNPTKTFANMNEMLIYSANKTLKSIRSSGLFCIKRDEQSTIASVLVRLEKHFNLAGPT